MLVYRYENEEGEGPLGGWAEVSRPMTRAMIDAGRYTELAARKSGCWHNGLPTPEQDGIDLYSVPYDAMSYPNCGCLSARQLVTWFPKPCREVLTREGFRLTAYEVPEDAVLIGEHQVVFDRDQATEVSLAAVRNEPAQLTLPLAA